MKKASLQHGAISPAHAPQTKKASGQGGAISPAQIKEAFLRATPAERRTLVKTLDPQGKLGLAKLAKGTKPVKRAKVTKDGMEHAKKTHQIDVGHARYTAPTGSGTGYGEGSSSAVGAG